MADSTDQKENAAAAAAAAQSAAEALGYNQQQIDEIKNQNKLLQEQDDILKQAAFSYDKRLQLTNQIVENEIRMLELSKEMSPQRAEALSVYSYINEQMGNISASLEEQSGSFGKMFKQIAKANEALKMRQKFLKLQNDQAEKLKKIKDLEKLVSYEQGEQGDMDRTALAAKRAELKQLKAELDNEKNITEELQNQAKVMLKQGAIAAPGVMANAARGLADIMAEPINAYSAVNAEVNRLTNGNSDLMNSIEQAFENNDGLWKSNIGLEKLGTAVTALEQRSLDFKNASTEVQGSIALTVAQLDTLGVSTETSGELFNIMTKNFGQSGTEFTEFATQMLADSKAIGVNIEKYTSDFQASFPVLSKYGSGATDVFRRLAAQSRKTGLSVQELTSAMGQFDTFEGAAENASKLNMLLGSQLDTTRLLAADESERIEMIKSQFSGEQFKKMDRFRKKAIAAAAGFSDVGTFEKAMSGGELGEFGDRAETANIRLAEAAERATNTTDSSAAALANMNTKAMLAMTGFDAIKDNLHLAGIAANGTGTALDTLAGIAGVASFAMGMFSSVVTLIAAAGTVAFMPILIFGAKVLAATAALSWLGYKIYSIFGGSDDDEEEGEKEKSKQQSQSNVGSISNSIASVLPGSTANIPKINMTGAKSTTKSTTKNTSDNTSITSIQNNVAVPNSTQEDSVAAQKQVELTEHALNEAKEQNRLTREMLTHIRTAYKPHQTTMQSA